MKAQVLLPKVFNFPFTYNSIEKEKIGDVVEVPFGSKNEIGVIWKNNYSEPKNIKIKNIVRKTGYSIDAKLVVKLHPNPNIKSDLSKNTLTAFV